MAVCPRVGGRIVAPTTGGHVTVSAVAGVTATFTGAGFPAAPGLGGPGGVPSAAVVPSTAVLV
ncbi:hypothetical protein ND748_22035 [Frankia sp. AiPs1]|uniref:hypothetical protein n=1 Tax=Frankia sp. AiPs1 TaxID=573493 RepID=UPI002043321A|nr:hypothetical protein [Frankia sp. AiPs1]MCM3924337.1 hypothetical protein [Frankia sp. AiPs1]